MQRTTELEHVAVGNRDHIETVLRFQHVDKSLLPLFNNNLSRGDLEHIHRQPPTGLAHDRVLLGPVPHGNVDQAPVILLEDLHLFLNDRAVRVGERQSGSGGHKRAIHVRWVQIVWKVERLNSDAFGFVLSLQPANASKVRDHRLLHKHHVTNEHAICRVEHDLVLIDAVRVLVHPLHALLRIPIPELDVVRLIAHHRLGCCRPNTFRIAVEVRLHCGAERSVLKKSAALAHRSFKNLITNGNQHIARAHHTVLVW
mmetsp:Transcript_26917/g.59582  ORF Transcript_26917/g.59582 Transcript_26917/m.59582 type:complete len:256 (-) Transcript_26917:397-1164(-)